MYKGLPLVTRCCFCAPLRPGLLVWAYVKLVFNIIFFGIGLLMLTMSGLSYMPQLLEILLFLLCTAVLLLCLSDLIFNFALVVGAHKKNANLLRCFYRYALVHAFLFLTLGALTVAFMIIVMSKRRDGIRGQIVVFTVVYGIFTVIYFYQLVLVRSALLKYTPDGQIHFQNHTADPECYMQLGSQPGDKSKEILTEGLES